MIVKIELEQLGFHCRAIEMGRVDIVEALTGEDMQQIRTALSKCGLEVADDKKYIIVDKIKGLISEMIHRPEIHAKGNFSCYLSSKLHMDYTYLANVFSEMESNTIEQYVIMQRILIAKNLIAFSALNLTEISWKLNYSSVAHLSTQFKKVTGLTPSMFKRSTSQLAMCEL